ncbi:MAG: hypothetical protein A2Y10_01380 [Planctomycetes bacterium GWF2_41_51]|nr:MAG: hypothetical protein A2Y10_01380 [Planctomycetes bacterium GWF2_41_51]HBG26721.1 HAF repeat-containing protein [Phycisphaerales bacterium]
MKKIVLLITLVSAILISHAKAAPQYTLTDLGTLGGTYSFATCINNKGQVAGDSTASDNLNYHAFLYDGTTMKDLGAGNDAIGINNNGLVVGGTYSGVAFLYNGTSIQSLGTLGGRFSIANSINDKGQIVGVSLPRRNSTYHAFLYEGSTMKDLGLGDNSHAISINNNGQIVGAISGHAFLYANGNKTDIGSLGGSSSALGINNNGQITGYSYNLKDEERAFLYDGTTMKDLGTLGHASRGWGINDSSQVVGNSYTLENSEHAFLYDGTKMIDLNSLVSVSGGWVLERATCINNLGQIAGQMTDGNVTHAFLMTPVPEPCTIALLALGGLLLRRGKN